MDAISELISGHSVETIVDLGCGTGRFTGVLAQFFSAHVLGIDPALRMLAVARRTISSTRVRFVQGRAESVPAADDQVDMAFLSMVYHHLQDKERAISEISRVIKRDGCVCLRTATLESINSYLWVEFFPRAHRIELARMPSRESMVETMRMSGFLLKGHAVVRQLFAENLLEYAEKISLRGISSLRMLEEKEFAAGLDDFREYCRTRNRGDAVFEDIDLFTFVLA
jgi:ubiquinone/menaquinone biosynthesis C-methylase UbiE